MNSQPSLKGIQVSIFCISASLLTYEIVLLKIFSIQYWYHFAYLIISVALLGFGASGTFVFLCKERLINNVSKVFFAVPFLLVGSVWMNAGLCHIIDFNPLMIVWQVSEILDLAILVLAMFVPFFLGAVCIGLGFLVFPHDVHKIYFSNLSGSGVGAVIVLASVFHISPYGIMLVVSLLAFLAIVPVVRNNRGRIMWCIVLLVALPVCLIASRDIPFAISPFKDLSLAMNMKDVTKEFERYGPLGLVTVVDSPAYHYLPDLSLNCSKPIPYQKGLFVDGNTVGAINGVSEIRNDYAFMECRTASLAYTFRGNPKVLIIGGGGGTETLNARFYGAEDITVVEMNTDIVEILQGRYRHFSGHIYDPQRFHIYTEDGRGYLQRTGETYDLIQMAAQGSMTSAASGVYSLSENYLFTKEALKLCIRRLAPGGLLTISSWIKNPPRESIKLLATMIDLLRSEQIDPSQSMIMIRSWQTATLVVKNGVWDIDEIRSTREFCRRNRFDLCYYPGIREGEVNRINRLEKSYFFSAAKALFSGKAEIFYDEYPFYVTPATDNQPFFSHFFKLRQLMEYVTTKERTLIPFIDWGYVLVWLSFLVLVAFSLVFIVAPVRLVTRVRRNAFPVFVYFASLGLAYMFLEIALLQQFIRYLADPVFSATVVISSFLVYSGVGSLVGEKVWKERPRRVSLVFAIIVLVGGSYMAADRFLLDVVVHLPLWLRMVFCSVIIAPLAVPMGVPFPSGLSKLGQCGEDVIPWAWGINGFFSVIGASAAVIIAMGYGFRVVIISALFLYVLSGCVYLFSDAR